MIDLLRTSLTRLGVWMAHPAAFLVWLAYLVAWLVIEPDTFDWHASATLATWLMTLFIQRAEHRDTQAIHAKLDEILKAHGGARTELREIDDEEPEDIERARARERNRPA
ncbi:MAG: low affinity iron permease family protein [Pseudomonadota bacterium]